MALRIPTALERPALASVAGVSAGASLALLAVKLSPLLAVGAFAGLALFAVVYSWPFFGFLLTSFVIPLERIGRLTNDSAAATISLMRILGTLTLAGLLLQMLVRKQRCWIPAPLALYSIYFGVLVLSAFQGDSAREGIRGTSAMLSNVVFLLLTVNVVKTRREARQAIQAWLLCTVAIGIFTIYQFHAGVAVTENQRAATGMRTTAERFATVLYDSAEYELLGNHVKRAIGSTSDAAVYGINLILALPYYFWLLRGEKSRWKLAALLVASAIVIYNILLTNTRAVILTLGFCLLLCFALGVARLKLPVWIGLGVLCLGLIPFIPADTYERVLSPSRYTLEGSATLRYRLLYWKTALGLIAEHPWLGVGAGNQSIIPRTIRNVHMPQNASAHNEYINSLMEAGLFGYLALVAFMAAVFARLRAAARNFRALGDEQHLWLSRAMMVNFFSVLFFAFQADVLHFPLKGWWLAMGLGIVLARLSQQESSAGSAAPSAAPAAARG